MSETRVTQMMREIKEELQPALRLQQAGVNHLLLSALVGGSGRLRKCRNPNQVEAQTPDLSLLLSKDAFPTSGEAHMFCSLFLTLLPTLPLERKAQELARGQNRTHSLAL